MELETTTTVAVERLRLDRRNPRLIGAVEKASDEAIIARLYRSARLNELLQSFSANGYMNIEPLVVMSDPGSDDGTLVVLEGNRRLAALRLLREPDLAGRIASTEGTRITVPPIDESLSATLQQVSVYPVANRERARPFIGFKHINGPAKRDAYAKARFAAQWYGSGKSEGIDLTDIARAIGDLHDTIKRMVFAIYVLDQARDEDLFDIEDRYVRSFNFSHLYAALSRSQYLDYLDLRAAWVRHDPEPNQVPPHKREELRKVLAWIYGSKKDGLPPVIQSQNPDIKRLGEVLAHAQGRHVLETTRDLGAAHASTESVDWQFTASLVRARDNMRDAVGSLRAYDGQDQSLLDIAEDVKETAEMVHDRMVRKRREVEVRNDGLSVRAPSDDGSRNEDVHLRDMSNKIDGIGPAGWRDHPGRDHESAS